VHAVWMIAEILNKRNNESLRPNNYTQRVLKYDLVEACNNTVLILSKLKLIGLRGCKL